MFERVDSLSQSQNLGSTSTERLFEEDVRSYETVDSLVLFQEGTDPKEQDDDRDEENEEKNREKGDHESHFFI